jgi:hypothetical protein
MNVFSIFKEGPIKKFDKLYESKLEEVLHAYSKYFIKP